jgi:hypothetical protein
VLAGETSQEEGKDDQDPPTKLLDDNISLSSEKNNHKKQKSWCWNVLNLVALLMYRMYFVKIIIGRANNSIFRNKKGETANA